MNKKIAILDSGVFAAHKSFNGHNIMGFGLYVNDQNSVCVTEDFMDENGHGTAIYDIVSKMAPNASITNIKIYREEADISQEEFENILQYILINFDYDIINMSMGIVRCGCTRRLQKICSEFRKKGAIIVSAFDNSGAVSIPAMLDDVIGVDGDDNIANDELIHIKNSIIDVAGKLNYIKVAWIEPEYILVHGNSFLAASITARIANMEFDEKDDLLDKLCTTEITLNIPEKSRIPFDILNAAIFPFNKEVHAIARFEKLLSFNVIDYYSIRVMGNVGRSVSEYVNGYTNDKCIKDINLIDWDNIDTLIIGHTDICSKITQKNYKRELIEEASKRGKNIFTFDDLEFNCKSENSKNIYCPKVNEKMLEKRFGKLYHNNIPILSVIGTNSKQGKYTLQLMMRERLIAQGYRVGQIGTEPTALLFGMDEVFPCGYNSTVALEDEQIYSYVNQLVHSVVERDVDIILAGAQTSLLGYNKNNVFQIPLKHRLYFEALQADAIILCVNLYDEKEYIIQSVKLAEGLSGGKVIALACLPMKRDNRWYTASNSRVASEEERKQFESSVSEFPLFWMDQEEDIYSLTDLCLKFFTEQ